MSEIDAREELRAAGLSVNSLALKTEKNLNLPFFDNIKLKDVVIFSRQFSVMISANVAVFQALKILIDQTEKPKFRQIIMEIADAVDSGSKLSDSMERYPKIFSDFYVNIIRSGESSGKLDETLNYLADEMEKDYDMTSKIKGAMIYPAFIFIGLIAMAIIMMVFVVPKLTGMLTESGAELPTATKVLIGISDFMVGYWWTVVAGLAALPALYVAVNRTKAGRKWIDRIKLSLPVFGRLSQRIYLVRFTRSMNTLLLGGLTVVESLRITAGVITNEIYRDLINETIKEVEEGNSISTSFIKSKLMPRMVSQMMVVGEKTGKLDVILARVSEFYTREINNIVANLMTLMEPIIMVIMGAAVAYMISAIVLPMYKVATAV